MSVAGAQVFGEEVHVKTPNLIIQSVQDTATYEGKQQNLGGQITVGYGVSGSANFSRSSINADYASVTEQSGIYAGDGGYQIEVAEHTELIGGLITSTAAAEAAGHNHFSTGTLSVSDVTNHAEFKGSSVGLGVSGGFNSSGSGDGLFDQRQSTSDKSGLASAESSGSVGYGQVSDSEGSTTYSGINTKNILITDAAKQTLLTGLSAEAMADRVLTATMTENAEALSGALENRFDAAALQKELDTQRAVSQAFSQNVQSAKAELNQAADRLTADYEAGRISQVEYDAKRQQLDNGALLLSTIAAGLSAPTDSALGIATVTLSPSVAKEIGQYFKSTDREGSTEHLIAHGLLAAAVAATGGNNALSAAGAAMSAEAAAPVLAHYLYGKEAADLNADEKATISSITGLVGVGVGASSGSDSSIAQGAQSAGTAVDNNYLTQTSVQRLKDCLTGQTCRNESEKAALVEESKQLSKFLDEELAALCAAAPTGDACRTGVHNAIQYIAIRDAWEYIHGDVERSSQETFDYLYNQPDSRENFLHYMNTIDNRADFFAASNQYEQQIGSGVQWFGGADFVSRAAVTGLGADGNLSYLSFAMGKTLGNPPIYEWRKAAGDALIVGGFDNFKDLYNNQQDPVAWDIKQLKNEQALLQPIHEKYLSDYEVFRNASKNLTSEYIYGFIPNILNEKQWQTEGIDLLDYESRVSYGCKLLGYSEKQGCKP